jgi:hypothetical protein
MGSKFRRHLECEILEDRLVASGTPLTKVSVPDSGTLLIEGTSHHDRVIITEIQKVGYVNRKPTFKTFLHITALVQDGQIVKDDARGNRRYVTGITLAKESIDIDASQLSAADAKIVFLGKEGDDCFQYIPKKTNLHVAAFGGIGKDTLFGANRDDLLVGGPDNDWLRGEYGDDLVMGGAHDDHVYGGPDNDIVLGGTGQDTVHGDTPANTRGIPKNHYSKLVRGSRSGDGDDVLEGGIDGEFDNVTSGDNTKMGDLFVIDRVPNARYPLIKDKDIPKDSPYGYVTYSNGDRPTHDSFEAAILAGYRANTDNRAELINSYLPYTGRDYMAIGYYLSDLYNIFHGDYFDEYFNQ